MIPAEEHRAAVRLALIEASDVGGARAWVEGADFDVVPGLVDVLLDRSLFAMSGPGDG